MCLICDGFTLEEVLERDAATIAEGGFVVQMVQGSDGEVDAPGWAYTIGLLDSAGHPELVAAGADVKTSGRLLQALAGSVMDGERFEIGDTIRLGGDVARVGAVHNVQFRLDTFNMWHNLKSAGFLQAEELDAVQIVMPHGWFCAEHGDRQPLLSNAHARVDVASIPPNRATRRARERSHRRNRS
ncbi:MAG: hypothetical protein JWL83_4452 [Actinomycetia bacterium]|jgi:hypothetical protein|nr:hypothetical protein [Actinomycetes bacterium]